MSKVNENEEFCTSFKKMKEQIKRNYKNDPNYRFFEVIVNN